MRSALILTFIALAAPAAAEPAITQTAQDSFDNVAFALESAILGRGLVIDHLSHVGEMLERTKEDVGSTVTVFTQADVFSFCSAAVSRQVMEVNPANIQYCPYGIFLYETLDAPGTVTVGYRDYPEGEMQAVEDMLAEIVAEALG
ncbi:DUF302 domain-containing protein [Frigidibacter sp.]|uniref:DUF302 domain-containing protein n=1 Tax=Frigidibacter sp. TaxID=2586418 RepID=UPI002734A3A3|nr:DUF302 domain-containing protein [Frigidibacter sp.]MDP3341841.1 DUF302 domain-containing protein [Frigidibacter sp.]